MKVKVERGETGTTIKAANVTRFAVIRGVITRCQPDGYSLTLYETMDKRDVPRGYCHIPAFWMQAGVLERMEAAGEQWVTEGVIAPVCQNHLLS